MFRNNSKDYLKYFFVVLFLFMMWLSFLIIKPFLTVIITSVIAAYIFYPVYLWVKKKLKYKNLSAAIVLLMAILLFTIPFFFVANTITKESYVVYLMAKQRLTSGQLFIACDGNENMLCRMSAFTKELFENPKTTYHIDKAVQKYTSFIIDSVSNFIFSIPTILLNFFVMVFIMFYLLRDGDYIYGKFKSLIPLSKSHKKRVLKKFNDVTYAVVYGTIIVALVQGTLGALGLFMFGVTSPVLWGIMMVIASMIPFVGPPVVWVPIVVVYILNALSVNDPTGVTKGILMILYFALIVGTADNILKPRIIGGRSQVHPVLVLLGVVGGILFFGFIGIVIGPVILAIFVAFLQIYESEKGKLFLVK